MAAATLPRAQSLTALRPTDKAAHVARRWSAPALSCGAAEAPASSCCDETQAADDQWGDILRQVRASTFSVSAMAFQDAWTVDLERLRHCYLHVLAADGRFVPFCAYNLTAADGYGLGVGRRPARSGSPPGESAS